MELSMDGTCESMGRAGEVTFCMILWMFPLELLARLLHLLKSWRVRPWCRGGPRLGTGCEGAEICGVIGPGGVGEAGGGGDVKTWSLGKPGNFPHLLKFLSP